MSIVAGIQAESEPRRQTSLRKAPYARDLVMVKALVEEGIDVNSRNSIGSTPLIGAASEGHIEVLKVLIAKGAGVNSQDIYGWTPLMEAAIRGRKDVVELLIAKGADVSAKDRDGHITARAGLRCTRGRVSD